MLSIIDGMWAASLASLPTLMTTITDVTTVGSGLSAYTVYNVLVIHPAHPETRIPRRHSEFVALHHCLKNALANDNPDLTSFFDFEFVKKSVLKSKEALAAERKGVLQKYLTLISTNPVLFGSNFVKRFLSFPVVLPIEHKNKFDDVWQFHQNRLELIKQLNYVVNTVIPPERLAAFVPSTPLAFSQQLTTKQTQIIGNKVVKNLDRSGRPGDSASAGRNGEPGHGPGNDGTSGTSGGEGQSGESAQRVSVFIQSDPQLQKLTVNDRENNQIVSADEFYLNSITLAANGGNGGAGGAGGNGGHGAQGRSGTPGTRGQNGTSYSHDGQPGHPGGAGGPGGNGGNAGHGGRGGDGGNAADIQIYCHDPRTLLAVTARSPQGGVGGRGGRGGTAGHGGAGGHGGRGGDGGTGAVYQETETYYDRDPDGRSIQRHRSVTRHGRNGPRGHDGPAGRSGSSGSNGYNGADGRNGSDANLTFFVLDANGGVIESATSIYHPSIVVVATDGDCDGIFSPGDTITFTVATVMNEGGLTLPAGAQLMKSDHTPVVALPAIAPQEQCSIKASYTITVPTIPPPTSPGVFSSLLGETITMEFEGKTFMSYLSTYSSRWPFKIDSIKFPKVLSPGDSTQVSVSIGNISKYEYGAQSAVQVAIKLPLGLSLPIPPDSISDMVQKWVMNTNDELECSFPIAMEDNVFSPDESVKARVELYWKGTFIEFMEFEVKSVPTWKTYLAGPPADVIILHNTIKSTDEHMAWSKVTNHLNLTAYFWDTNYYPIDLFDEYITNPKCSNAVLVCSLDPANEVVKNTVQTHLQRNKGAGYMPIDKDMTTIPIDGVCDVGGALTSFHADASDSRYWSLLSSQSWYDFKSLFAPSLTLPVISRLICALPVLQKLSLLTQRLADLPCYGWIWEEVGITVLDIVARSLKYDFVTSFQAKDFMAQRVVQKVLLEHSDFARNKKVVGAILVAIQRVDKLVRVFTHDKVWDHMKRCLKNALALDGEFKKECKAERELVTKRLKHIKAVLNTTLELKKTK